MELSALGSKIPDRRLNINSTKSPNFYSYMDTSDGEGDSDHNMSANTGSLNVHNQGSQCSISSNELDNPNIRPSEIVPRLTESGVNPRLTSCNSADTHNHRGYSPQCTQGKRFDRSEFFLFIMTSCTVMIRLSGRVCSCSTCPD